MKRLMIILLVGACSILAARAQIYDGITQPTLYRIWVPVTVSLDESGKVSAAPFIGYKWEATPWLSLTPVFQYNLNTGNCTPQLWVNLNYGKRYYLLLRSMYDTKTRTFRETISATAKLPKGFMVDATWGNMLSGDRFAKGDRLQVVGGYGYKWFVVNAGYSMRDKPGFIVNIRFKITEYNWLQLKYDSGTNTIGVNVALQFN